MGDVITLRPSDAALGETIDTAHLCGTARCLDCSTEWKVVAPVGTVHLECPKCLTSRGVLAGPVLPKTGDMQWECNCGCDLFKIHASAAGEFNGILCIKCGIEQSFK